MSRCVFTDLRAVAMVLVAAGTWTAMAVTAAAQTTVVLDAPQSEVVDTSVRGGDYAGQNFDAAVLTTRASGTSDYVRRILLKFDTENNIPFKTAIRSATLTLTVSGGNDESRRIAAYRVSQSFDAHTATWARRKKGYAWGDGGGDLGKKYAEARVAATVGSKLTFDVTRLVQETVNGSYTSRYTRIALLDEGESSRESYREYYPSESPDASVRPVLTVVYGPSSPTPTDEEPNEDDEEEEEPTEEEPPTQPAEEKPGEQGESEAPPAPEDDSSSTTTLRVLHWNTHHGGIGTDGKYDPDRLVTWIAKFRADIISLNEVDSQNQANGIVNRLNVATGRTWNAAYSGWGNLLITRLPLDAKSVCLFNASAGRKAAHLSTEFKGRTINILSAHLAVEGANTRLKEAKALQACAADWTEARIIAGDYNMQVGSNEYNAATTGYVDTWKAAKAVGAAINYPGNKDGATRNSRIDYIFFSARASFLTVKSSQVFDTRDSRGHMPSDHKPMLTVFTVK